MPASSLLTTKTMPIAVIPILALMIDEYVRLKLLDKFLGVR
jgi:hypothetical protein